MGFEVLIVDDDYAISDILSYVLRGYGLHPITASNGAEALTLLKEQVKPALILTDYSMPMLNGGELIDALSQEPELKDIPVVLITGSSNEEMYIPVTDNLKGIIAKPFHLHSILNIIFRIVNRDFEQCASI